ncbi:MAG: ATP-binding cassette domain-containing protein, partial [Campylobacteraceae bacterium]|nr:ATP-binding cassette domain-containing protein [Campylobacteraceae bacterium]
IGILSGGEKNRVALALLFTKQTDCLILDEPTNDLDIPTINILEEAIKEYAGAVIFVSHDRYFVDKIAKKLFIFKENGVIEESYISYSEFLEIEDELKELDSFENSLHASNDMAQKQKTKSQKLSYKEQIEYETLPKKIDELEIKIKELKKCLSNPECYQKLGITTLTQELEKRENELEPLIERYLEIDEKVQALL